MLEKVPNFIIIIKIPNMEKPYFRLIDCPWLCNETFKENVMKKIKEKYYFSKKFYLTEKANPSLVHFYKEISVNINKTIFMICHTKYDELIEIHIKGSKYYEADKKANTRGKKN
jgi:hypothetical protein